MDTKLQIALDDVMLDEALALLHQIEHVVDIIEIGTPFMMRYGMEAVRMLKQRFPGLLLLCDTKIMDAGAYEADLAYQAGADMVTVLGVTDDQTVREIVELTHSYTGKKVMVDMICAVNPPERIARMEDLGADILAVHTGVDQQALGRTPLDDLREMRSCVTRAEIAVAGGIKLDTLDDYMQYCPDIVIVGSGITHAEDPAKTAAALKNRITAYEQHNRINKDSIHPFDA